MTRRAGPPVDRRSVLRGLAGVGVLTTAGVPTVSASGSDERETAFVRIHDGGDGRVRSGPGRDAGTAGSSVGPAELRAMAARSQSAVVEDVRSTPGLSVLRQFWLANGLLVACDPREASLAELARRPEVAALHPNFRVSTPDPEPASTPDSTYGLDQIGAADAWERFDTRGEGATVGVVDTGVDPDHPDVEIDPENFAEFDRSGERVSGAEPRDTSYHGTHVSGTAVGGAASGEHIGVAPAAELVHAVGLSGGEGTFAQVVGAMEWVVERGADVLNTSLGVPGFLGRLVEPVRNAERAGVVVVASAGNAGAGTTGSPGNVYESLSVGATDESEAVAEFSGGERIDTSETWGDQAPESWPDSYVVPDVVAPGVGVKSAVPLGADLPDPIEEVGEGYALIDGTSMSTPHVSGLVALLVASAREEYDPAQLRAAIGATARTPSGAPSEPDPRYGRGIVDAPRSVGRVAAESGVAGTVADPGGVPVEDATVALDGFPTETGEDGTYRLRALRGDHEVRAEAFGFGTETRSVEIPSGTGFETVDFELSAALAARRVRRQPSGVEAGERFETAIEVANAEALTITIAGDYDGNADLLVDGRQFPEGRRVPFEDPVTGELPVEVLTGTRGEGDLELRYAVEGLGETVELRTGTTSVFEEPIPVAVVDRADSSAGDDVAIRLDRALPPRYRFTVVEAADVLSAVEAGAYEAYVVQDFPEEDALVEAFVERTRSPSTGVVYLEQFGDSCNAISRLSAATGDPGSVRDRAVEIDRPGRSPPVAYDVEGDHPVLEGVSGVVRLYTPLRSLFLGGYHSSFDDYEGVVDGRRIATTRVRAVDTGGGIGVDDLTRTVLAASLGQSRVVSRDDFTADADRLLGNAVRFAAETPPVVVADTQTRRIDPGESTSVLASARRLEAYTVDLAAESTISESAVTLTVDGDPVGPGQTIPFEDFTGELTIGIETTDDAVGTVSLAHEFVTRDPGGETTTTTATTGPTSVYAPPVEVPADAETIQAGVDLVAEGGEVVVADGTYEENAPDRGFQSGVYVGTGGITLRAAEGASPTVLHPKDLPSPNVVNVDADGVTVEGLTANVVDGGVDPKNAVGFGVRVGEFTTGVTVRDVTAGGTSAVFLDRSATEVLVEGVTALDTAIAVGTDVGGGPVANVTVRDVVAQTPADVGWGGAYFESATAIEVTDSAFAYGEFYDAGVFVHGPFDGAGDCRVANNEILGPDADTELERTEIGIYLDRVSTLVEDNAVTGGRVGVRLGQGGYGREEVFVRNNDLSADETGCLQVGEFSTVEGNAVDAETGIDFDGGFSGLPADGVLARFNDLSATDLPLVGRPAVGTGDPEGPFDARLNYLGDRAYDATIADGEFAYDPFLTAPPEAVDREAPTAIGTDLRMAAGGTYGLGVPGPTGRTIREVLTRGGATEFEGGVETWNSRSERWEPADLDRRLAALDALRVSPESNVRAILDFQSDGGGSEDASDDGDGPGDDDAEPRTTKRLREGTNVVPAPRYGRPGIFEESGATVEAVERRDLDAPASQVGPDDADRSPFAGHYVEVSSSGTLRSELTGTDPQAWTLLQSLGLDPDVQDDPGVSLPLGGGSGDSGSEDRGDSTLRRSTELPSVEALLDAADDEVEAARNVTDLLGARIAAALDGRASGDGLSLDAFESTIAPAVGSAPENEVVRTAVKRAFRQVFAAEVVVPGEDPVPTVVERRRERGDGTR